MDFKFKKKYGQNFLKNENYINDIVSSLSATKDDLVIEIGPGSGALTKKLIANDLQVLAYEIDRDVDRYLSKLNKNNLKIIYDDFLKRDIKDDINKIKYNKLFIIGNLPYYITTPIITKIIEENLEVEEMVFMVQKEVALRFSAKPKSKEYGSITVFLNYYFDVQKLFDVNKNNFVPIPNVDSAIIKFKKKTLLDTNIEIFNKLVKDAFQFKRKNLNNNLNNYDKNKINEILRTNDLSLSNRAEDLSYEIFVDIANKISK